MIIEEFKKYLQLNDLRTDRWREASYFVKYCQEKNIQYENITYDQLQDYFLWTMKNSVVGATFNIKMMNLRLFYKFLIASGRAQQEIYKTVKLIKPRRVVHKVKSYVTKDELTEIIQMGESFYTALEVTKFKALMYFMFYTGLRKGEILHLKRADIDLEKQIVIVKTPTKNRVERVVPFPKVIASTKISKSFNFPALLKEYFATEGEVNNAFNMTEGKMQMLFKALQGFAPEKRLTAHLMRHSFARMLARSSIDSRVAQKLLGHKDIKTTLIYYDPDIDIIQNLYKEKIK